MDELLSKVKANLILEHTADDELLKSYITAAVSYAESYQHIPEGYYKENTMPPTTEQAVIMLSSHFYESRDGSTGGFFADNTGVAQQEYYKEMYLTDIERKWGVDLSAISAEGSSTKRWDFVVKTDKTIYVIETNFYGGGGSKLNETARSYKMIAEEARDVSGVEFVWVTDGGGWRSARRNLEETFNTMQHLYNINDMENGVFLSLF